MKRAICSLAVLVGCLAAVPLQAQDPPAGRERGKREMEETVRLFALHRMRESLDLTEEQTLKVLPLYERMEQLKREFGRQRRQQMRRLHALLENPDATDGEILELVRGMERQEGEYQDRLRKVRTEFNGLLSPRQQGQYVIFEAHFRRRVREQLRRSPDRRRNGPPRGGRDWKRPPAEDF